DSDRPVPWVGPAADHEGRSARSPRRWGGLPAARRHPGRQRGQLSPPLPCHEARTADRAGRDGPGPPCREPVVLWRLGAPVLLSDATVAVDVDLVDLGAGGRVGVADATSRVATTADAATA